MGLCLFLILVLFFSGPLLILPLHCPPCSPRQRLFSSSHFSCWGHVIQAQGFRDPLDIDGSLISVSTPGPTGEALDSHINGAFFSLAVQTRQDQRPHHLTLHLCSRYLIAGVRNLESSSLCLGLPPPIFLPVVLVPPSTTSLTVLFHLCFPRATFSIQTNIHLSPRETDFSA